MITFDPDKKPTKRTWMRRLFSLNMAADVRRARLDNRDLKTARGKLKAARSAQADVKDLKKRGILK
ncbi:hypothetical protein ACFWP7_28835 [Streptomyces sp. NPDC058470]|uniref:hypothetical protein n=1 Tax=Streptomyces sp. NPDC058470 TaxID=3346515 RepID=UPI003660F464